MKKYFKFIIGLLIMPFKVKYFSPQKVLNGKRVTIVGPATSAYDGENGRIIDGHDYIIRINKALVTWNVLKENYIGTRTDILIHNFHENTDMGGAGPIDFNLFDRFGVKYLIQPRFDTDGWRSMLNYFKKYLDIKHNIYILHRNYYRGITNMFAQYHPTKGFCALYVGLNSPCEELFITGFTFFKTPYVSGYRDHIADLDSNKKHIEQQGLHNIDLEYQNFLLLIEKTTNHNIFVDAKLYEIIAHDRPDILQKIKLKNETPF